MLPLIFSVFLFISLFALIGNPILDFIVIVIIAAIALFIFLKLGSIIVKLIVNVIIGFITLYGINLFLGLGITFILPTIIIVALFGLPGVIILVILKLFGYNI
ncbi:MAG: pro-sigmaK processing inhibitor BofA family protein [Candidatus Micrarchaeia archaeon]